MPKPATFIGRNGPVVLCAPDGAVLIQPGDPLPASVDPATVSPDDWTGLTTTNPPEEKP